MTFDERDWVRAAQRACDTAEVMVAEMIKALAAGHRTKAMVFVDTIEAFAEISMGYAKALRASRAGSEAERMGMAWAAQARGHYTRASSTFYRTWTREEGVPPAPEEL